MTQPAKSTDKHTAAVKTAPGPPGGAQVPIYGPNIFSIVNPNTGEEVNRVEGFGAALDAQAAANAKAARFGQ